MMIIPAVLVVLLWWALGNPVAQRPPERNSQNRFLSPSIREVPLQITYAGALNSPRFTSQLSFPVAPLVVCSTFLSCHTTCAGSSNGSYDCLCFSAHR